MQLSNGKFIIFFTSFFILNFVSAKFNFADISSNLILSGTNASLVLGKTLDNFAGTLKITDKSTTSIMPTDTGNSINFTQMGNLVYGLQNNAPGSLKPGDGIYLQGGQALNLDNNTIDDSIKISGIDNLIYGSPTFTPPIILQDSATTVTFSINTKFTNNISMNGGSVYLQSDLLLKDDVHITGSGTIFFNGYSLEYPVYHEPITSDLTFVDANDITVTKRVAQTSNTNFNTNANIVGYGVILDFTGGGSYTIASGVTVYISGLHFKGIGSEGGGNIILSSSTSKAYFTKCIFDLKGTFTQTAGLWDIEGAFCKMITGTDDHFVVSGAGTKFLVDGQVFQYESLNQLPTCPISTTAGGVINTTNGGMISSDYVSGNTLNLNIFLASSVGPNYTDVNIYCGSDNTLTFSNENIANAKSMILDAKGNVIEFGEETTQPIVVAQNVTLTIQNAVMRNFDPTKILLQGTGSTQAKVIFGNNVILETPEDLTLPSGILTLTGNTKIWGESNSTLYLSSQSITLTATTSSTVTFRGLRLKYLAFDGLKSLSSTSTILFQNCELYMTNTGITMDTGYFQIADTVKLRGTSEVIPNGSTMLTFSSKGLFTILSGATLEMHPDTIFNYTPNISSDGGIIATEKRHFVMTDPSSMLNLRRATINTGTIGLAFDYGKLLIDDVVTFNTSYTTGYELEIGSAVNLSILQHSILNMNGLLKYTATTYGGLS